jgi:hypothetical protein
MNAFVIIVILILLGLGGAAPVVYSQVRKRIREQKNYERGLKMVPLLIHLPPPSDDTELAGRDVRDIVDENISKAQVIYNIIASTVQKGFKAQFYGQRHFAFEIVGTKGFAYFYAAVPLALVDVVKQAVVSAYPSARLEEVPEHNIFSPVGKVGGTVGGELHLKESFAYPIATFQDLKRDAMQAILNSLSTLDKEDGAGIQILMRPANPSWRKTASGEASKKRKGDKDKKGGEQLFGYARQLGMAFVKPPEEGKSESKPKELSSLEQATLDSIDDKTRHPGYEVLIRVVVSSNLNQRAQVILNNIVAAFSLFDAQGKNGFKFSPAKSIDNFITNYILRIFPQEQNKDILNSVELATIFHFPDQRSIPTSQLERQDSKQVDGPRNMPDKGLLLGYNIFRGVKKPIRLSIADRQRHMYSVGQTGTGKSTFLENLAMQDMMNGDGFAFVDPHGDTAEKLLSMVPKHRVDDVIYFCPSEMDYPMGLNLFEYDNPDQKDFLIQEALNMLYKLYDPQHQGIMGPRYEHLFRNAALTIMADPAGGTFVDIPKLFRDPEYVKQKLQYVKDQNVIEFWQKEMPQSSRSNEFGEVVSWFVSKFGAFLSNEMMRNIIGQTKSSFNLRDVMDNKKILLVNLSKGRTGELNSKLLGMVFVMKFQAAAMSRASIPEKDRKDFALYVDEFQNFSTDSFATILSEARKYHLNLIVANQFTTQLTDEIRDAVFGNIGTIVAFRVGQDEDAEALGKRFRPQFDSSDLLRIPNYNAVVRTLVGGVPTNPFSMATLPPLGTENKKLPEALKQLSAAKFGRPKAAVEKEIFSRLATKAPPVPAAQRPVGRQPVPPVAPVGAYPPPPRPPMQPQPAAPKATGTGSFLDEWINKRVEPLRVRPSPWDVPKQGQAGQLSGQPPRHGQLVAPTAPAAVQPAPHPISPQSSSSVIQGHHTQPIAPESHITSAHAAPALMLPPDQTVHRPLTVNDTPELAPPTLTPAPSSTIVPTNPVMPPQPIAPEPVTPTPPEPDPPASPASEPSSASPETEDDSAQHKEIFIDADGNLIMK